MALKVNNNFIVEDIVDENNNKLGELKFNPKDSRIVNRLMQCLTLADKNSKELNKLGEIEDISKFDINDSKDAERISENIEKMEKASNLEEETVDKILNELNDIFGKDTIEIFTGGTKDIESIMPILDFIKPHIQKARSSMMSKYMPKKSDGIME